MLNYYLINPGQYVKKVGYLYLPKIIFTLCLNQLFSVKIILITSSVKMYY